MLNHIKSVHEKKKNFNCSLCDFATFAKSNLKQHIIAVHEGMNKVLCINPEYNNILKWFMRGKKSSNVIFVKELLDSDGL